MRSTPRLLATLWLALPFAGCAEQGATLPNQPLRPDPSIVDFGEVASGGVFTREVTFKNLTDDTVSISSITADGAADPAFSFELVRSSVGPGNDLTMLVVYAPTTEGPAETTWLIRTTPSEASTVLTVKGSARSDTFVNPLCELPAELDFGPVLIGTTKSLEVPLCNVTANSLSIELLEGQNLRSCLAPDTGAAFCWRLAEAAVQADGRFDLPAQQTYTLTIELSPTIAGTQERGGIVLRSCDNSLCENEVRFTGSAIESGLRCAPTALDFGKVNPGECVTEQVICENISNAAVTVTDWGSGADIGRPTDDAFEVEPSTVRVLRQADSMDIGVSYCPTSLGNHTGTLYLDSDQATPRAFIPLSGAGGGPAIDVRPAGLTFGLTSTQVATTRSVLVLNSGVEDLEISSIVADALNTGAFSAPGAGPALIPPGGSLVIEIEFHPVRPGPVESELVIFSNDAGTPEVIVPLSGEGISLPSCQFELSQSQLNFGQVRSHHLLQRVISVRNSGANDCLITAVQLEPGSAADFSLANAPTSSLRLAPGETQPLTIQYAPVHPAPSTGAIEISLSSTSSPVVRVPLLGTGEDEGLLLAPRHLDFGASTAGCTSPTRSINIYNPSAVGARLTSVEFESGPNGPYSLPPGFTLPFSIPPGGRLTIHLESTGPSAGFYNDALEIVGELANAPFAYYVSLNGESTLIGDQEERFEQVINQKVDLLFVIDNSASLGNEQALLAENFPSLVQLARGQGVDYQIAVTTTDTNDESGRLVHPSGTRAGAFSGSASLRIITESTAPSAEAQFRHHAQASALSGGAGADEAGFWATYQATSPALLRGHNVGFLRPDAALSVIYLSDEPEQSSRGIGAPFDTVDFYRDALLALKGPGAKNQVTVSAIAGDHPGGCNGATGAAAAGPRYIQLAVETGGAFSSVCSSNWPDMLRNLSPIALGIRSKFYLEKEPVVSTIEVEVDGVSVPATMANGTVNWTYGFADNSITFSPFAMPNVGAEIMVRSTATCR